MIKEIKKYTDDDGKSITAYIPMAISSDGKLLENAKIEEELVAYEGQVGIPTPMGVAPVRFPFPQEYTLEECFSKFEEVAEVEVEKILKKAEEKAKDDNLIITPGQASQQGRTIQFPG